MKKSKKVSFAVVTLLVLNILFSGLIPGWEMNALAAKTINITNYGAVANDSVDDTAAIKNAVNDAASGDVIYIPNGVFDINEKIVLKTGVKLEGQSQDQAVLRYNYIMKDTFNTYATGSQPSSPWTSGITGTGSITLQEDPSASDKSVKMSVNNGNATLSRAFTPAKGRVEIEANVKIEDTTCNKTIYFVTGTTSKVLCKFTTGATPQIVVKNNGVDTNVQAYSAGTWYAIKAVLDLNAKTYNFYVNGVKYPSTGTYVMENISWSAGINSVKFAMDQSSAVGNWYVDNTKVGVKSWLLDTENYSDISIKNITIDGNNETLADTGIFAKTSDNLFISHVTVKDFARNDGVLYGIKFSSNVKNSEVSDCTITNIGVNNTYGTAIRLEGNGVLSKNKILRNNISYVGRGGICGYNSEDLVIQNNIISNSALKTSNLAIELWQGCHRGVIEDNIMDHRVSIDGSDYCAIRRNSIYNPGTVKGYSLELIGSDNCIFTNNSAIGGHETGILVANNEPKNYIYWGYNTIKNTKYNGAQLQGNTGFAKYHYFYKTQFLNSAEKNGVWFNGNCDYMTFDSCTFSGNASRGLSFSGSNVDHLTIENCSISNNVTEAFGPYSGYTALELTNNKITGNGSNANPAPAAFGNKKPVAAISSPATGSVGQAISFQSSSYDPDEGDSILHLLWDFGDGIPSVDTNPTYTFNKAGTYRVTLLVWDQAGRGDIVEKTITITDPSGEGRYDAEAVPVKAGCSISYSNPGYTGTGYIDYGSTGSYIEWNNINMASPGKYTIVFRYAFGGTVGKNLQVTVNGIAIANPMEFLPTGSWTTWKTSSITADLNEGLNTIRFTATDTSGPNVDCMEIQ